MMSDIIRLGIVALGVGVLAGHIGCRQSQQTTGMSGLTQAGMERIIGAIDTDRLQSDLYRFSDQCFASIAGTAGDIAWSTSDRTVREAMTLWKIRSIPTIQQAIFAQNPRLALLDVWIICLQMEHVFQSPDTTILSEEAHLRRARETTVQLRETIEAVALDHIPAELFEDTRLLVSGLANRYPLRKGFAANIIAENELRLAVQAKGLTSLLAIPLSGVAEGATAIDRMAQVAAVFTEVVEHLPQYARWQAELLMLDVDSMSTLQKGQQDFERFAHSVESLSETAKTLPADLRRELEQILDAADQKQENLHATVTEARQAMERLDSALARTENVVASTDDISASLREVAAAWESTGREFNQGLRIIQSLNEQAREARTADPDKPYFDINDYAQTGREFNAALIELRGLLDDYQAGKWSKAADDLEDRSKSPIDYAKQQAYDIVNRVFRLTMYSIGVIFVLVVLYRLLVGRLMFLKSP